MPRPGRAGRARITAPAKLTREQAIAVLESDPAGALMLGAQHSALAGLSDAEATNILAEVDRRFWARREAIREPVLRARLAELPVCAWGAIFSEAPELEAELSAEQRNAWRAWRAK